jgi:excisionase family DNA binding protein
LIGRKPQLGDHKKPLQSLETHRSINLYSMEIEAMEPNIFPVGTDLKNSFDIQKKTGPRLVNLKKQKEETDNKDVHTRIDHDAVIRYDLMTLNTDEVANVLQCHEQRVLELAQQGELPGAKIGRGWIFRPIDVAEFLQKQVLQQTAQRAKNVMPFLDVNPSQTNRPSGRKRNELPMCVRQ